MSREYTLIINTAPAEAREDDYNYNDWHASIRPSDQPGTLVLVASRRERVRVTRVPDLAVVDLAAKLRALLLERL